MTDRPDNPPAAPPAAADEGQVSSLRGQLRPVLYIVAATLAVELGAYFLALGSTSRRDALLLGLGACTVWVCLAAGPLAVGGRGALSALLRGGAVADASLLSLLVYWALDASGDAPRLFTFVNVLQTYCTLAALAIFAVAMVLAFSGPIARCAAATASAVVLMLALTTPLWTGSALQAAREDQTRRQVIRAAVYVNPFYSISSPLGPRTQFVWHQAQEMYRLTRIGDYAAPPPVPWYASAFLYGCASGILAMTHLVRRKGIGNREEGRSQ